MVVSGWQLSRPVWLNELWRIFGTYVQLCIFLCPLKLLWKWNNLLWAESRPFPNCLPGSFEAEEDPDPRTGRVERFGSEGGQLRMGHTSQLPPRLCACPSGTSAGIARCLAETVRTHLLQTKEKAFHLPTGFSICFWSSADSRGKCESHLSAQWWWLLNAQALSIISKCYMKVKKKKKDRLYIRKHFYNHLYACMCIHKYIHICMYAVINILHLCLNWR